MVILQTDLRCCPTNWHQRQPRLLDPDPLQKSTPPHDACIACKRRRSLHSLPKADSAVYAHGTCQVREIRADVVWKEHCTLRLTCKHARAIRRDFAGGGSSGYELSCMVRPLILLSYGAVRTWLLGGTYLDLEVFCSIWQRPPSSDVLCSRYHRLTGEVHVYRIS